MNDAMDLKQFNKYIADLSEAPDKWGLGAHRKIASHLKKQHKQRLRKHVGPNGAPWPKTWVPPMAKVGDVAQMELSDGTIVRQEIKTRKGKYAYKQWRKKYGPPTRPQKALVRPTGNRRLRATKILDRLVTNVLSTKKTTEKRRAAGLDTVTGLSYSPNHLLYGFKAGTSWIEKLQNGGLYKGKRIPVRVVVGLNDQDTKFIKGAYVDALIKFSQRKTRGKK